MIESGYKFLIDFYNNNGYNLYLLLFQIGIQTADECESEKSTR